MDSVLTASLHGLSQTPLLSPSREAGLLRCEAGLLRCEAGLLSFSAEIEQNPVIPDGREPIVLRLNRSRLPAAHPSPSAAR